MAVKLTSSSKPRAIRSTRAVIAVCASGPVAVSFGDCFGWFHPAAGNKAVLLCGALGYEGFCAHHPWRILADQLQAAGLPALRFDYQGTGDSLGVNAMHGGGAWRYQHARIDQHVEPHLANDQSGLDRNRSATSVSRLS